MNPIICQIETICRHCLESSKTDGGLNLGDLRDIAFALGAASKTLHAEVDARFTIPTGGLLANIGKNTDGGAA